MMDLETYRTVLEWKLDRKLSTVRQFGFDEAELALRQDMAAMKVVWYNSFVKDWWWCARTCTRASRARRFCARRSRVVARARVEWLTLSGRARPPCARSFMRNTHPVLATCLSHRLHMVSKRKRFFVYYMLVALHMTFSVRGAKRRVGARPSAHRLYRACACPACACPSTAAARVARLSGRPRTHDPPARPSARPHALAAAVARRTRVIYRGGPASSCDGYRSYRRRCRRAWPTLRAT